MRSGKLPAMGTAVLGVVLALGLQSAATAEEQAPWHISKVSKLNRVRDGKVAATPSSPRKYLQIEVRFNVPPKLRKKHNFRVTDVRGKEVGELWGWNDKRSLVIFQGSWGSLKGLYLDANGHREPLVAPVPVAPKKVVLEEPVPTEPVRVGVEQSPTYEIPRSRNTDYNIRVLPGTTTPLPVEPREKIPSVVHEYHYSIHGSPGPDSGTGGARSIRLTPIPGTGAGSAPGSDPGAGPAPGSGTGPAPGPGTGTGPAPAPGPGSGPAPGSGVGPAPGPSPGAGPGEGVAPAKSPGEDGEKTCETCGGSKVCPKCAGKGCEACGNTGKCPACGGSGSPAKGKAPGTGSGPGKGSGPGTPPGPGMGPGPGTLPGMGPGPGMLPGMGPAMGSGKGPGSGRGGRGIKGPFRPRLPGQLGPGGYGLGPGGLYGPGASAPIMGMPPKRPLIPAYVLYVATGEETGPGKVYQVDEHGRVLGWVNVPHAPTGIALHRNNGLVLAVPRDGGKIMRIDETGKLSTVREKDKELVHPVDVALAGKSDTVLVADNIADVLAGTNTGGTAAKIYQRLKGQKWATQEMSVAVTNDKHVILGTDGGQPGVFRFAGDEHSAKSKPLLPGEGAVAADPKSLCWAATQKPNQVYLFEGGELVKKLRLPPGKRHYRNGLLSFSTAGNLVTVARDSDEAAGKVWFFQYRLKDEEAAPGDGKPGTTTDEYLKAWDSQKTEIRSLFPWTRETINDFVVGPRMLWDRSSPNTYKSTY